jgi:hypothetical protein
VKTLAGFCDISHKKPAMIVAMKEQVLCNTA